MESISKLGKYFQFAVISFKHLYLQKSSEFSVRYFVNFGTAPLIHVAWHMLYLPGVVGVETTGGGIVKSNFLSQSSSYNVKL